MINAPDIVKIEKIPSERSVMNCIHPAVQSWIKSVLGHINELQRVTIPRIMNNKHTLVMAPTGAGKTLAAFLGIISKLCTMEDNNLLENKIYVLYISPLKALNNDIHKNLEIPLDSIRELNNNHIAIGKRTGDTSTRERAKIARNPPHILITTPESLALMLTAPKFKEKLRFIKWVIVDEIHAIAGNKRGSLLSICLERLEYYLTEKSTRIGLSATVEPPKIVANYLVGNRKTEIGIINMVQIRKLEVDVISPVNNLVYAPHTLIRKKHNEIIVERIDNHQTSLIFTNTRYLAEKLVLDIQKSRSDLEDKIAVHHGSLSKEVRLDVEERLKAGKMKAVFTSTSLEMGIDIGSIDHTVQLGSPKTVRAFTQRIGRSGHSQNLHSKGSLLVFDRDDLIECMAIAKLSTRGLVDSIRIPKAPVDVLFQMLVGMAVEKRWSIEEAFLVITRSYPYRDMNYDTFLEILNSAATTTDDDNAWKYALIWVDLEINEFGRRKKARQSYMQNIGTIPDASMVDVVLETYRTRIGQIADRFAENLGSSDVFILGGKTYQYIRTVGNKIIVKESFGLVPTIPHWVGEAQTRTIEISQEISNMFNYLDDNIDDENISEWLIKNYYISDIEAESVLKYVREQMAISALPTINKLIVEEYIEPSGLKSIIVLSIFGRETNLVLAQALATKLSNEYNISVTTISTDNGILLRLPMGIEFDFQQLFKGIRTDKLLNELEGKIRDSELFKNRFRHVAGRSLMILKRSGTRKNSVDQQAKQARWLIKALPPEYPVVKETIREILYDTYNLKIARELLYRIERDNIEIVFNPSDIPSPMSHSILLNDNSDIVLMDDKKSLLLNLHQQVLSRLLPDKINPIAIFDEQEIKQAFIKKLHIEFTENEILSVERFAEYPIVSDDFMQACYSHTGVKISRIKDIVTNSELIVPWLKGYTTKHVLPYHAACFAENIWENYDSSYDELKVRSRDLSPSLSIEYLINYLLKYSGPVSIHEMMTMLDKSYSEIKPVLDNLVRKHEVLAGTFFGNDTQYMLYEDRKLLDGATHSDISLNTLTAFRLEKLRLSRGLQSSLMSINQYLEENGPVRDTIEFVARLPSFDWIELRDLLAGKLIYFGRFLGRRLVFVNKNQINHFITITRDKNIQLDEITREVLLLIQEYPGMTIKDIMKFIIQPKNVVQASINILEQELYISRTGWDLSLTQGGFPNPQYVALPVVKITALSYDASVKWLLHHCIKWYGPLTLQDLLRITRLPYNVVESSIVDIPVIARELFNYNYYGLTDHFRKLEQGVVFTDDIFILSPLDPYFYMISGSFRQEQLPRHSRLMVVHRGKTMARIEIAIPDKDILQVLNIQISIKNMQDFDLIEEIGRQLLRIAGRAYSTQAVVIEEINFKAANHTDNKSVVLALKRVNYILKTDYLITGTRSSGDFDYSDILETRLINLKQLNNIRYSNVEVLFDNHDTINIHDALNLLDLSTNKAKLLISRAIREGKIHHRTGILYHPIVWKISEDKIDNRLFDIFLKEQRIITMSELINISGIKRLTIEKYLNSAIKSGLIENISPFSKTIEYRLNNINTINRREKVIQIVMRIIRRLGPLTFGQIRSEIKQFMKVSRIEVLLIIADLLNNSEIYSHSAFLEDKIELIYFLPTQSDILMDVNRKHKLDKWTIYNVNDTLFENLNSKTTHLLTYMGDSCAELQIKIDIDNVSIENIKFYDILDIEDKVTEIINKIEEYFFDQGFQQITIKKIQNSYPKFWIKN